MSPIREVAELLSYKGPTLQELINEARHNGNEFEVCMLENGFVDLFIRSNEPYGIIVQDIFRYDADGNLIKQLLKINGQVKTVFDKFEEANILLEKIEFATVACS